MRDYLDPRVVAILQKGRFTREQLVDLIRPVVDSCTLAET